MGKLQRNNYSWIDARIVNRGGNWCVKWKNDTGSERLINTITARMGSVDGTCKQNDTGASCTGNGKPYSLSLRGEFGSSVIWSDQQTVSKSVGTHSWSGGVTSDVKTDGQDITWNFSGCIVPANTSVTFYFCNLSTTDGICVGCNFDNFTDEQIMPPAPTSYTVTFDLQGGTRTGGGALSQTVSPGGSATPPTCSRAGYTFAGWDGDYTNVRSNRTIYAKWNIVTYTIKYDANGGNGIPGSGSKKYGETYTIPQTTPTANFTLTLEANGTDCTVNGKSRDTIKVTRPFKCWNTRKDGSGTNYYPGGAYTANENVILYAQYESAHAGDIPNAVYTKSSAADAAMKFVKWTTTKNDGSKPFSTSTNIIADLTIYGFWDFRIAFRCSSSQRIYQMIAGGSWTPQRDEDNNLSATTGKDSQYTYTYRNYGQNFFIPYMYAETLSTDESESQSDDDTAGAGSESGYMFMGWDTSSEARNSVYGYSSTISRITAPVDLYAVFDIKRCTVTFLDGFGEEDKNIITKQVVEYGHDATPPDAKYVQDNYGRPGYSFQGWLGDYTNVKSDINIMALWGFTPIWIMHNKKWVRYRAREEE